jgi:lipopolysaccharide transport system permease protein
MEKRPQVEFDGDARIAYVHLRGLNGASSVGWQIHDPLTATFVQEGEWQRVEAGEANLRVLLPQERGRYHVYISAVDETKGWDYQRGRRFLLMEADVESGRARLLRTGVTTIRKLRLRNFASALVKAFTYPVASIWSNRALIQSMVRRDILSRYRGSFGDIFWTVLNPVLLMATYFFVFGIVLQSRFGPDNSRTGFSLYFLAGMLPWLPFSEAVGRAPHVLIEHRNFIKKLVFPVEVLPVTLTLAALVTEAFALAAFVTGLFIIRGDFPVLLIWLPLLLIPRVLFTLGVAWCLSALGVFVRDLGQVIGFILTLWFFLTPICYPEASLPKEIAPLLMKNPIYQFVRGYRELLLENRLPEFAALGKLWAVSAASFVLGYAWFHKLRKSFADVI